MSIGERAKPLGLTVDASAIEDILATWADEYFTDRVRMALSNVASVTFPIVAVTLASGGGERVDVPFDVVVAAIVDMITSGGVDVRVVPAAPKGGTP